MRNWTAALAQSDFIGGFLVCIKQKNEKYINNNKTESIDYYYIAKITLTKMLYSEMY